MPKDTSIDAFNEIIEERILPRLQDLVHKILLKYGPMTANQIYFKFKGLYKDHDLRDSFHQRMSELKKYGCAIESGKVICPISGRKVYLWRGLDVIPTKPKKTHRYKCALCGGKGYLDEDE